jgi:hypothetical protein
MLFKLREVVSYSPKLDPVCPLCGIPLMQDKLHLCGEMDWVYCKNCNAKWNPGVFPTAPETCGFCVIVIAGKKN